MNNKYPSLLYRQATLAFTLSLPLSSIAEVTTLDDMLVTASRSPIVASQSGGSYTIITSEEIERSQQPLVLDLLRNVPGIAVSRSGGIGGQTQIRMRGAEADQTLIMIDGIEANDPGQGSSFDFAHLLTSDIERIEIMRGPQSSVWGSDAMGGVINIITKSARTSSLRGGFEAGSFSTMQTYFSLQQAGERYGLALNGNFINSNGINVSEEGGEKDGYRNSTLNLKANFNPLDNLDLLFTVRQVDSEKDFDPIDPTFVTSKPVDGDRQSNVDQIYSQFKATLDTFDGHWQHVLHLGWTRTDNDNFADQVETGSTDGQKRKLSYQSNVFFNTPSFANAKHTLILALEHEKEEFSQRGTPSFFGDPNQDQEQINRAIVGEYRISLLNQLHLAASARHDENDVFDDATTWRSSLAWSIPNTGTTLRVAYGTGNKNPSFTERFGFTPNTFVGNPNLKPEKSRGWEIGIDQSLWDNRLFASFSYFDEELEDEINGFVFDPMLGGFTAENVSGESEREGIELSLKANITNNWIMNGMVSYVDSKQPDSNGILVREIRRPELTASFNNWYQFLNNKASINLNMTYTDSQDDNDFSTFPATKVNLNRYYLVNIAGEYKVLPNVSLFARVDNLFNREYQDVFGFETPGIAGYAGFRVTLY